MPSVRTVKEGVQEQGSAEKISWILQTKPAGGTPTSPSVKVFDLVGETRIDVTGTVIPAGTPSIAGDSIVLPLIQSLTPGHTYRVEVSFVSFGNTEVPYFLIQADPNSGPTQRYAIDSSVNKFDGLYTDGVKLGSVVNRAWFPGSATDVADLNPNWVAAIRDKFVGNEVTVIIRGKPYNASVYSDGVGHNLISIYTYPYATDLTIDITVGGLVEWTMMTGGFPGIVTVQISGGELNWATYSLTASKTAGQFKGYKNGTQQGSTVNCGINWTNPLGPLWVGSPKWLGWASDCIISFGIVATQPQLATIHTKLEAGTLTTTDLDTIFGAGNYGWWKLDEG